MAQGVLVGFFEQNPEFGSIRSDREQEVLDAIREREERTDKVMADSLLGECQECGALTEVMFGYCTPCMEIWVKESA